MVPAEGRRSRWRAVKAVKPIPRPAVKLTLEINDVPYLVTPIYGDSQLVNRLYQLTKLAERKSFLDPIDLGVYHVAQGVRGDQQCDCPNAIFRPDRPHGCKHVQALRMVGLIDPEPVDPRALVDLAAGGPAESF